MQRIYGAALGTTFVVVMLNGCVGDDPDTSPSTPGSDGGTTPTSDATGGGDGGLPDLAPDAAPPALCPLNCLPPAAADWTGPSATFDGAGDTKPGGCPTLYTVKEIDAHQGMKAAPAACTCGAPQFTGAKCTADVTIWNDDGCTDPLGSIGTVASDAPCLKTQSVVVPKGLKVEAASLTSSGSCTYPNPGKNLAATTFDKAAIACGLPQFASCEGRADCVASPVPEAPFTRLCIHRPGEHSCPSADYAKRFVAYTKVADTRDCEGCTGTATGGTCGTGWGKSTLLAQCANKVPLSDYVTGTSCIPYAIDTLVNVAATAPTAMACSKIGGTAKGTTTSTDPVTFCCNR